MREPLKPTSETPAMTVMREIHLDRFREQDSLAEWQGGCALIEPQSAVEKEDGEDADEEDERSTGHLVDGYRSVEETDVQQLEVRSRCDVSDGVSDRDQGVRR